MYKPKVHIYIYIKLDYLYMSRAKILSLLSRHRPTMEKLRRRRDLINMKSAWLLSKYKFHCHYIIYLNMHSVAAAAVDAICNCVCMQRKKSLAFVLFILFGFLMTIAMILNWWWRWWWWWEIKKIFLMYVSASLSHSLIHLKCTYGWIRIMTSIYLCLFI